MDHQDQLPLTEQESLMTDTVATEQTEKILAVCNDSSTISTTDTSSMSKTQLKKLRKRQELCEKRRVYRKEAKVRKQMAKKQMKQANLDSAPDKVDKEYKADKSRNAIESSEKPVQWSNVGVVLDCHFDSLMNQGVRVVSVQFKIN
jgi:hypothetical protein